MKKFSGASFYSASVYSYSLINWNFSFFVGFCSFEIEEIVMFAFMAEPFLILIIYIKYQNKTRCSFFEQVYFAGVGRRFGVINESKFEYPELYPEGIAFK